MNARLAEAEAEAVDGRGAGAFEPASRTRRLIARRMVAAKRDVPEFTVAMDVGMDAAVALREGLRAPDRPGDAVPSLNDMVVRACALALREHPDVNASWVEEERGGVRRWPRVNVGMAVAAGDALLVPTIRDADAKPLGRIAAESRALAQAVRERAVTPDLLADGTFTVSNLGMLGVRHFEAILNAPQAAILAVGGLRRELAPGDDGGVEVVTRMTVTLTCDHRVIYGADAARFLTAIRTRLEDPSSL